VPPDRDIASLHDMVQAAKNVRNFVAGMDRQSFLGDIRTQSAVIHQVLIIGEACKRLSQAFRTSHPNVPWTLIARTRDILIHHYEGVDLEEIWRIVERDIPTILNDLNSIAHDLGLQDEP
jgi:uncharacterized protein with HEPN domain